MWQGSWIRLWTVTSLFCCMPRIANCCLLKRLTKHATSLYLCIFEIIFEKPRETYERGLFCESCGITDHTSLEFKFHTNALSKKLIAHIQNTQIQHTHKSVEGINCSVR